MSTNQLNILLADDDIDDCVFFKNALSELNFNTHLTAVNDGEELMQYLINEKNTLPNILFLDLNMPRKTGFECLSEIKQNKKLKNLPVVIFSTSKSQEKIKILFKKGATIYVSKPGDYTQLKQVIQHALSMTLDKITSTKQLKYILNA